MIDTVLPLRFVNTPTVKEIWEVENDKKDLDQPDSEVEALSDEYDNKGDVTGTEGYYKLLLGNLQQPFRDVDLYSGTEGLWAVIKSGTNTLIENVKKFFKWLFGFFTSKQRMVDQTTDKLEQTLKVKGVKEGPILYSKDYPLIWNAEGKPGQDITWVKTKLGDVEKVISGEGKGYVKELKDYLQSLSGVTDNNPQLSKAKADFERLELTFVTNLAKIVKPGPFLSGGSLEISKAGKFVLKANPKVGRAAKGLTYTATLSTVNTVLNAINHTNEVFGEFTKSIVELENVFVTRLNSTLKLGNQLELEDEATAKALSAKIQRTVELAMANIKMLETVIYKSINAALTVTTAAVKKDGAPDKKAEENK